MHVRSPSTSSPPPLPALSAEEEDELIKKVITDSKLEYKRSQWDGLEVQLALSAAGDVAVPEPNDGVVLELPAVPWDAALEG